MLAGQQLALAAALAQDGRQRRQAHVLPRPSSSRREFRRKTTAPPPRARPRCRLARRPGNPVAQVKREPESFSNRPSASSCLSAALTSSFVCPVLNINWSVLMRSSPRLNTGVAQDRAELLETPLSGRALSKPPVADSSSVRHSLAEKPSCGSPSP